MIFEHLVYSAAIALVVGLIAREKSLHWKNYSCLVVLFAFAPDLDMPLRVMNFISVHLFDATIPFPFRFSVLHLMLHTLGALLIFGLIIALLLYQFNIPFLTGFIYAAIAYGAHLFEDALVYAQGYSLLWPLVPGKIGIGLFGSYQTNFLGIANTTVLLVGVLILFLVLLLRIYGYKVSNRIRDRTPNDGD